MSCAGKKFLFGLLLLGLILVVSACSDPSAQSSNSLQNAKGYLAEKNLRAAAIELKNALQANPDNAEARYLLGLNNLDFGDVAGAEKEFRRAIKAGWNEEQANIGLARALILSNAYQNVIDEIKIKDEYSPNARANLYALRAAAFLGQDKRDLAQTALSEGARLDPKAFHVLKTTIHLDLINADLTEADKALKQALAAYPESQELLLLDAVAALQEQDNARAAEALKKVIDLEPKKIATIYGRQARLRLASLQITEKQIEQAHVTLEPLFKLFPKDPQTNYLGGLLAFAEGDYEKSEERLLKVLEVAPEHIQTILLYGTVSFQKKKYQQAANYLSKYINVAPGNIGARKLLGRSYMMLGQGEQAQKVLKQGLDTDADDVELLALVGLNEMREGNLTSGIESLAKAAEFAPENTALRKELAMAYITSGETELAIQELNLILAKSDEKGNTKTLLVLAHLKAGQPAKAIDTALEILGENPDNPAAITLVGSVFAATGDKKEARNYYDKALKLNPGNPQASFAMAQLEESEGNLSAATTMYQAMVDADTKSIAPMLALARLADKQGDKEGLFTWLERARAEASQQVQPRILLTEAYLNDGDLQKAEIVAKESRVIAPDNSVVRAQWSRILMRGQRYNEALTILTDLIEDEPDSVYARLLLTETYLNLKQTEDAIAQLKTALEKDPNSLGGLTLMARIALEEGNFEEVEEYAKKIQSLHPQVYVGYELEGDAWSARRDYANAKNQYEEAWKRKPSSNLAIKLATIAARMADPAGVDILRTWTREHEDDIKARQALATLLQTAGQQKEAVQIYQELLAKQPDNFVVLNNLAGLYQQMKNPKAVELAERAYRLAPDNPGVQDTYGWILVQAGQLDKGRNLLKQAFDALPGVAEVRYHYAATLIRSGQQTEGSAMLKTLLSEAAQFEGREEAEKLLAD